MKQSTAILKRLVLGEFNQGVAPVFLDGEQIGELARDRGWYWSCLHGGNAGGGRNIPNALRSLAFYAALKEANCDRLESA